MVIAVVIVDSFVDFFARGGFGGCGDEGGVGEARADADVAVGVAVDVGFEADIVDGGRAEVRVVLGIHWRVMMWICGEEFGVRVAAKLEYWSC